MSEPVYDEDNVNLGYLKRLLGLTEEENTASVSKNYVSRPVPPYNKGDTWIDGDKVYTCIQSRNIGLFNINDWTTESGATEKAESKNKVYLVQPSNYNIGDMWILQTDTDHTAGVKGDVLITNTKRSVYNANDWVNMMDYGSIISINEVLLKILTYMINHLYIKNSGVQTIFFSTEDHPSASSSTVTAGDFWFNKTNQKFYRLTTGSWSFWTEITDNDILSLIKQASQSNITADGKIQIFYDDPETITTMARGDICRYNGNKYRFNGTNWVDLYETEISKTIFLDDIRERTAKIETDLGEIDLSVREKVGDNEIVAKLNLAIQDEQGIIHIVGNQIIIESDYFDLDADGKITATSGKIGGFDLGATKFTANTTLSNTYTSSDLTRVQNIIMGTVTPTTEDYEKYDLSHDRRIDVLDYYWINRIVNQTVTGDGIFILDTSDSSKAVQLIDSNAQVEGSIGVFGSYFHTLSCNNFHCNGSPDISGTLNVANKKIIAGLIEESGVTNTKILMLNSNGIDNIVLNADTGNVKCVSLTQTSKEEDKKNFEKLENGLDIINNTDIYKYNLKNQADGDKKHIGFVIGKDFKYAHEITAENEGQEVGVDTYSMISVAYKAIQEQQKQIEELQNEIKQLKGIT